jgi:hypothetical protein
MKRFRIIGLMLLSLLALGAFAASTASAEEGVLPPETFTGTGGAGELATLGGSNIKCTKVDILEGKFLEKSDEHGLAILHFSECKAETFFPARTLGDESGIILVPILFLICLVEPVKLVFGILILPEETTVHVEVPSLGQLVLVKGAVIAELEGAGLKGKEFKYKLAGTKGDQTTALKCTILGKEFKHTYEAANDKEAKDEHASQEAKFTIKFTKEVELMDA